MIRKVPTEGLMCWNCGRPTGVTKVVRGDDCPNCMAALRSCNGCRHFDPTRRFQCRESVDKNIPDKDKPNFCEFFQQRDVMKVAGGLKKSGTADAKDERKERFDNLFDD